MKKTEKKNTLSKQFRDALFYQNPILVQLLGMCSTLAITTSCSNAIGMGAAVTVVLTFSNILISLLRKLIPNQIRIAAFIVIISGFVTAVQLIIKAYFQSLDASLGVFIPLIVVNCIILARAEAYASKNAVIPSALDGIFMGIGYTGALLILSAVRELAGYGSFFGISLFGDDFVGIQMFVLPAGAFILLGVMIAIFNRLLAAHEAHEKKKNNAALTTAAGAKSSETESAAENEIAGVRESGGSDAALKDACGRIGDAVENLSEEDGK